MKLCFMDFNTMNLTKWWKCT